VGFIRDLPEDLVAAFHATLEELRDASLLIHVVDASAPDWDRRIESVRSVLESIGLDRKPELLVFNQIDKLPEGAGEILERRHGCVAVSALTKQGLMKLLERAEAMLWSDRHGGAERGGEGGKGDGDSDEFTDPFEEDLVARGA
jgi:GTP-binding protein HflX